MENIELNLIYHVSMKNFLQQGGSNPKFYEYLFKKIIENLTSLNFSDESLNIMRQTACLGFKHG